ncbi:Protein of unknown function, DUF288 [Seminavis robusta]|uniref:Uncharacterized protein n=1 Tax=Seminavis robusta TaxID=568900 RepID=A0A9N8D6E1_9STRA|nr:Protein of unknown function, DUF288 [Seminavis robusta]|eukprot:Sro1_g000290.1 Protein of unknown function, DUF288 (927) ;mRNA; f:87911-90691
MLFKKDSNGNNAEAIKFAGMRSMLAIIVVLMSWRIFVLVLGTFEGKLGSGTTYKEAQLNIGEVIANVATSAATASRFKGDPVRAYNEKRRFGATASKSLRTGGKQAEDLSAFLQAEPLYQKCRKWAVVTTIYEPANAIKRVGNELTQWCMVVVADTKTPETYMDMAGWNKTGTGTKVQFLSVPAQEKLAKMVPFVEQTPYRSFARKNIGYLYAIWMGATTIFDFDDDNLVSLKDEVGDSMFSGVEIMSSFADNERVMVKQVSAPMAYEGRAFNPFPMMGSSITDAWPRGMPLSLINSKAARGESGPLMLKELQRSNIAVVQSVCDNDPDVDAIYRLSRPLPFQFEKERTKAMTLEVPSNQYSPYNAQATLHFPVAFWGLYLPITVNGRVSDIWRSYIVQRLLRELETPARVLYSPPMVTQFRNAHDYAGDFVAEQHLYLRTEALLEFLDNWRFSTEGSAEDSLQARIEDLWIKLYERQYIEMIDVQAVQEWLTALEQGGYTFPAVKAKEINSTGGVEDRRECARQRLVHWEEPKPTFMGGANYGAMTLDHSSNVSVAKLLAQYEATNPFPHSVDLICRAGAAHMPHELAIMIESVELYWPRCAGRVIIVLDVGDEEFAKQNIPSWMEVIYSQFEHGMPGRMGNQLFNMYSEQQGTSKYVAIMDTDTALHTPITPDLLFNIEKPDAPPFIMAETTYQKGMWSKGDKWMLKGDSDDWNFMIKLPTVWPRAMFPQYRAEVEAKHGNQFETTLLWKELLDNEGKTWRMMSQFCLLGNWMVRHWKGSPFDLRKEDDIPAIRYGVHLPYYEGLDFGPQPKQGLKDPEIFQKTGRQQILRGLCELFCYETPRKEGSIPSTGLADGNLPKLHSCAANCPNPIEQPNEMYFKYEVIVYGTPEQRQKVLGDHFQPLKIALGSVISANTANTTSSTN